jgi:hypothetical protein
MARGMSEAAFAAEFSARPSVHGGHKCTSRDRFTCAGCGNRVCWCVGGDGCTDERTVRKCTHVGKRGPHCKELCAWCWCRRRYRLPLRRVRVQRRRVEGGER